MDAYSRAYKAAKSDTPAAKTYKDNLYKIMQSLYKRRFDKDTGLEAYVAQTTTRPFPNPTSEVQPIADPDPAPATTGQPAKTAPAAVVTKPVSNATPKSSDLAGPVKTPAPTAVAVRKSVGKKITAKK